MLAGPAGQGRDQTRLAAGAPPCSAHTSRRRRALKGSPRRGAVAPAGSGHRRPARGPAHRRLAGGGGPGPAEGRGAEPGAAGGLSRPRVSGPPQGSRQDRRAQALVVPAGAHLRGPGGGSGHRNPTRDGRDPRSELPHGLPRGRGGAVAQRVPAAPGDHSPALCPRALRRDLREYDGFCAATAREKPSDRGWGRGRQPVNAVSSSSVVAYCRWLSEQTGRAYRLPSEAEWEYACRAGTTTPFHFGAAISTAQANYNGNDTYGSGVKGEYRARTVAVGTLPADPWGLHEVHGNVWEWVNDCLHDSYQCAPADGPAWQENCDGAFVVLRGGCWDSLPKNLRVSYRSWSSGNGNNWDFGFRLAQDL